PQPSSAPAQAQDSALQPQPTQESTERSSAESAPATTTTEDSVTTANAAGSSAPVVSTPVVPTEPPAAFTQRKITTQEVSGTIITDQLRVRRGPGTDYRSIGGLKRGERVIVLGRSLNELWVVIQYPKDLEMGIGWVDV